MCSFFSYWEHAGKSGVQLPAGAEMEAYVDQAAATST